MEKNGKVLSLGHWPVRDPNHRNLQPSPITKRILGQVHMEASQLLPLTYQHFLQQHHISSRQGKQLIEQYREEMERRKKQVAILADIRTNYILGKDYGPSQSKENRINTKITLEPRSNNKQYQNQLKIQSRQKKSNICQHRSTSNIKKSKSITSNHIPQQSQAIEPGSPYLQKEQSEYFVNFDPRKNSIQKHHVKEEESTKSNNCKKSKSRLEEHTEYGELGLTKFSKITNRKESTRGGRLGSSRQLCDQLLKTVDALDSLDQRHTQQLEKLGDLSVRERGRLAKMQSMERQQLGARVRGLTVRLRSEQQV